MRGNVGDVGRRWLPLSAAVNEVYLGISHSESHQSTGPDNATLLLASTHGSVVRIGAEYASARRHRTFVSASRSVDSFSAGATAVREVIEVRCLVYRTECQFVVVVEG